MNRDGRLIVPVCDKGKIINLQFISGSGEKRFLAGGRKKGGYFTIGGENDAIHICEGYATAASVHDATKKRCIVAFDAGNLPDVAVAIREIFPNSKIVICADNDANCIGIRAAQKAAAAIKCRNVEIIMPPIVGTDFNDYYNEANNE